MPVTTPVSAGTDPYMYNTTASLTEVCTALSNASYDAVLNFINAYTPSPIFVDELIALCATQAPVAPSTPPASPVPTPSPIYDEGMSEDDAIALIVGVCLALIVVFVVLGLIVAKRRVIGRHGVLDAEKASVDGASTSSLGPRSGDKYTRHVMMLRSAHRDGTAPRANGLPTIRMYIRAHRPIMLDVLWEADEEYERIECFDSSPSARIECQLNYDTFLLDNTIGEPKSGSLPLDHKIHPSMYDSARGDAYQSSFKMESGCSDIDKAELNARF